MKRTKTERAPPRAETPPKVKKAPPREPKGADKHENCAAWAASGECEKNPSFMLADCAASCPSDEPATPLKPPASVPASVTKVESDWDEIPPLAADLEHAERAARDVPYDPNLRTCVDERPDCASLARANLSACGEAPVMLAQCPKTCKACNNRQLISQVLGECKDTHDNCGVWAQAGECTANRRFSKRASRTGCTAC